MGIAPKPPLWYSDLDSQIKAGQIASASQALEVLRAKNLPRAEQVWLAELFRRVGKGKAALEILTPYVRPPARVRSVPTEHEKSEYAGALIRVGLMGEALALLESLPEPRAPLAIHYLTLAHMARWDFERAFGLLRKLSEHPRATEYQRVLAAVNLTSALLNLGLFEETEVHLAKWLPQLENSGYRLLYGITLDFAGQSAMLANRLPEAKLRLERALAAVGTAQNAIYSLYVRKSMALLKLKMSLDGYGQPDLTDYAAVYEEARQKRMWEVLRDLEFHRAWILRDMEMMARVYFGTRHPHFRQRVVRVVKQLGLKLPTHYLWVPPPEAGLPDGSLGPPRLVMHMADGRIEGARASRIFEGFKPGQLLHRLAKALAGDFYHPLDLATLHGELFPGRPFNLRSSPQVVHQALRRLRRQWERAGLPFQVICEAGEYRLQATFKKPIKSGQSRPNNPGMPLNSPASPIGVRWEHTPGSGGARLTAALQKVGAAFGTTPFSSVEAAEILNTGKVTAVALLNEAVTLGLLGREGQARSTRYRAVLAE